MTKPYLTKANPIDPYGDLVDLIPIDIDEAANKVYELEQKRILLRDEIYALAPVRNDVLIEKSKKLWAELDIAIRVLTVSAMANKKD